MPAKTNTTINNKNYYRIRRKIDGVTKNFYGTSKTDAENKYKEYIQTQADKKYRESNATLEERADDFIENVLMVSSKYALSTKEHYESGYRLYIKGSSLAKKRLSSIKASDIQKYYNSIDVSKQTIQTINKFMTAFYKWVVANDYGQDILTGVDIPEKPENKRHEGITIWEEPELKAITEALKAETYRLELLIYIFMYTGARISEALALKYSDIDKDLVRINRQIYKGELKPTKWNSQRTIPTHPELYKAFKRHKAWHTTEMLANGYKTEFVFTSQNGKPLDRRSTSRSLERFYKRHDIPVKNPHVYRATFCTMLCLSDVPIEVAASLMGHKSIDTTAKHYALVKQETKRDAINKLNYSG